MDGEPSTLPLSLKTPSGPPAILLDTLFLVFLRLVYFLLARRFLLSTLNPTLRDLSKTETLLAPTASWRVDNARSNRSLSLIPLSDGELDTEDDNPLSRTTPNSSFPPSPSKPNTSLPTSSQPSRDPFTRRKTDEGFHLSAAGTSSLPAAPDGASGGFELQALGQKLKDVGAGVRKKVDILQLSHGQRGDGGVKGIKQAMRGLSWLAR